MQIDKDFRIETTPNHVDDSEIVSLLTRVYVDGGFTSPEKAKALFCATAVRSRGNIVIARTQQDCKLVGMVIVVLPDSPARRLAGCDEVELHLLAVDPLYRGLGVGRMLLASAIESIHQLGFRKTVLWTQPTMTAAQRLYENIGFVRVEARDPTFEDMRFLAYAKQWL